MSKFTTWLKQKIPTKEALEQNRLLKPFAPILKKSPDYWFFNQSSVSRGCAVAVCGAFMPIPFQMVIAVLLALPLRANLIISLGLLWINNPLTVVPIYWFCYFVGTHILQQQTQNIDMHLSWHWMTHELMTIWKPFLLGCAVCGIVLGIITYFVVYFVWKYVEKYFHKSS